MSVSPLRAALSACGVLALAGLLSAAAPLRPAAQEFRVTSLSISASPANHQGKCPVTVQFRASITATRGGTVQYVFERSDGRSQAPRSVSFSRGETKVVTDTWTITARGRTTQGWMAIRTRAPNSMTSSRANFSVSCSTQS